MSPNECWQSHVAQGFEPVTVTPDEADELFRPHVIRTVQRCLINWNTNTYFHMGLEQYNGIKVAVGVDVKDGSRVWVREIDKFDGNELPGRLICVAEFAGNETRYVPKSYEDAAIENRAKAQLRLIGKKVERVEDQLRGSRLLEATSEPVIDVLAKPVIEPEVLELEATPVAVPQKPKRRVFGTDVELAAFALEQPDQLTENQKKILRGCLARKTDLDLFRLSNIDVDALRDTLRSDISTHKNQ
ncbi:Mu transposase C-terminal domain-containing protein [Roseibium sp. TrichSKD4]|uniref:Mu transposase C-terminal domain-containing protein n=1 Tax=Roseibium sp. TrichSKD4 TaxID=744980 RepID=UPI00210FE1FB|nr:Mu transposase C-terminal domain-containing protein [Roseibium sp. TrichSKD4]